MQSSGYILAATLWVLGGCAGSTPAAQDDGRVPPPTPRPLPASPAPAEFETRTDTLQVSREVSTLPPDTTEGRADTWFAVQIGAFKDPHRATVAQALARDRYHLPVINEFTPPAGLYQIRLGAFPSRDSAREFLTKMQRDFPAEYRDSWLVQLKR